MGYFENEEDRYYEAMSKDIMWEKDENGLILYELELKSMYFKQDLKYVIKHIDTTQEAYW